MFKESARLNTTSWPREKDTGTANSGTVVSGNFLSLCGTQGTSTTKLLLEQPGASCWSPSERCARHTLGRPKYSSLSFACTSCAGHEPNAHTLLQIGPLHCHVLSILKAVAVFQQKSVVFPVWLSERQNRLPDKRCSMQIRLKLVKF